MTEYKIKFVITVNDFEAAFDRKPENEDEFDNFCHYCRKGVEAQIDWDIVFSCARDTVESEKDSK